MQEQAEEEERLKRQEAIDGKPKYWSKAKHVSG